MIQIQSVVQNPSTMSLVYLWKDDRLLEIGQSNVGSDSRQDTHQNAHSCGRKLNKESLLNLTPGTMRTTAHAKHYRSR